MAILKRFGRILKQQGRILRTAWEYIWDGGTSTILPDQYFDGGTASDGNYIILDGDNA